MKQRSGFEAYRRFLSGDESALSVIVEEYNRPLERYLCSIVRDPYAAEDLAADCFLSLILKKPSVKEPTAFSAYLFRVAHHKAVDYLRKKVRNPMLPYMPEELDRYAENEDQLWQDVWRSEEQKAVQRALRALCPEYAQLLYLLYFEQMDRDTVGRILKKSRRQLTNLTYRAKQALKNELEREGFVYEND